jgi:hypothetical protein
LPLAFVFIAGHPREAKPDPPLSGILGTTNKLAGGAKDRRVSKDLSVELRPDREHVQLGRLAERNRPSAMRDPWRRCRFDMHPIGSRKNRTYSRAEAQPFRTNALVTSALSSHHQL